MLIYEGIRQYQLYIYRDNHNHVILCKIIVNINFWGHGYGKPYYILMGLWSI